MHEFFSHGGNSQFETRRVEDELYDGYMRASLQLLEMGQRALRIGRAEQVYDPHEL